MRAIEVERGEIDHVKPARAFLAGDRSAGTLDALAAALRARAVQESAGDPRPPLNGFELRERLREGADTHAELRAYLVRAFELHESGRAPLEVAMRLSSTDALGASNAALSRAEQMLREPGAPASIAARAKALSAAVKRFQAGPLKRLRRGESVELSPVERALWHAHAPGVYVKSSARRLRAVIESDTAGVDTSRARGIA